MTKLIISLVTFPVKTLLFLTSPSYFKSKTSNVGKILKTNDSIFSEDNYRKSNRRVVVTYDNGENIKVNKIHTDKKYTGKATSKEIKKQERYTTAIDYKKYPKALNKPSVVDKEQLYLNKKTGIKFKVTDPEFKYTGNTLSDNDLKRIRSKK